MRAAQAVRYLCNKGLNITPKDVENWVKWERLVAVDLDSKGRKLFNLEAVYALAAEKKPKKAAA
jgi:hypothetical protein